MVISLALAVTVYANSLGADKSAPVGYVVDLRKTVYVRHGGKGKQVRLGKGDPLCVSDSILCGDDSWIKVQLASVDPPLPTKTFNNHKSWFAIEAPIRQSFSQGVFDRLGRVAGTELGASQSLIKPAAESVVRMEGFALVWAALPGASEVSVLAETSSGKKLWIGSTKATDSPFRDNGFLSALQRQSESGKGIVVSILSDHNQSATSTFTILDKPGEGRLRSELGKWKAQRPSPLLEKMGEAQILAGYRLFNDSADAWLEAAKMAPQGRHVLAKTVAALIRIGDANLVASYKAKLAALSDGG